MKKLLLCCFVTFAFAAIASAQDTMPHKKMDKMRQMPANQQHMKMSSDCVMLTNGEVHLMKSGKKTAIKDPVSLSNGAMVMPDGTVKMKDGSTKQLKDGECMSMDGKMMMMKKSTTTKKTSTNKTTTPM